MSKTKEKTRERDRSGVVPYTVNMDQSASDALSAFCGETRIKKQVLARLITWFCQQDRTPQTLIVDRDAIAAEDARGLARMALVRIADAKAIPVNESAEGRGEATRLDEPHRYIQFLNWLSRKKKRLK